MTTPLDSFFCSVNPEPTKTPSHCARWLFPSAHHGTAESVHDWRCVEAVDGRIVQRRVLIVVMACRSQNPAHQEEYWELRYIAAILQHNRFQEVKWW